jgi:hypothetical protein
VGFFDVKSKWRPSRRPDVVVVNHERGVRSVKNLV